MLKYSFFFLVEDNNTECPKWVCISLHSFLVIRLLLVSISIEGISLDKTNEAYGGANVKNLIKEEKIYQIGE
jgi:hypothetical protein